MNKLDALLVRLSMFRLAHGHDMDQMGLLYVATFAAKMGFRVRVLDHPNLSLGKIQETLSDTGARLVGFYVDHENMHSTISAVAELKQADPGLLCIFGGPQSTVIPWDEKILRGSGGDFVVRGEGEQAFSAILDWFIHRKGSLEAIDGLTYREGNEVRRTREREPNADLDSLPFPDRKLKSKMKESRGIEYLVTSRGCPYRCAFCFEGREKARYRARSVSNVLAEVEELLKERSVVYMNILDDTFTANPERVIEFSEGMARLREKYQPVRWFCEGRANVVAKHPEMIRAAVKGGLIRIQIGVETGSQAVLDAYRKDLSLEEIREAVRVCSEADVLSIFGNFIIGGAFESWETLDKTVAFTEELLEIGLGRFEVSSTVYTPYPGTAMYDNPNDFGLEVIDAECVTGPGDNYCFARTEHLSKWEILQGRQNFLDAVSRKMQELLPRVPDHLLERHSEIYFNAGMQTSWFKLMGNSFHMDKYFTLPYEGEYSHLHDLDKNELHRYKPVRTVFIGTSRDGRLILNLDGRILELNEVGTHIFELAYGRLTVNEIIDRVRSKHFPFASVGDVSSVVTGFLENMDVEKLIVFTRV